MMMQHPTVCLHDDCDVVCCEQCCDRWSWVHLYYCSDYCYCDYCYWYIEMAVVVVVHRHSVVAVAVVVVVDEWIVV